METTFKISQAGFAKAKYKRQISYFSNTELIHEYESLKDLAQWVTYPSDTHTKKYICEDELIDSNLGCILPQ